MARFSHSSGSSSRNFFGRLNISKKQDKDFVTKLQRVFSLIGAAETSTVIIFSEGGLNLLFPRPSPCHTLLQQRCREKMRVILAFHLGTKSNLKSTASCFEMALAP